MTRATVVSVVGGDLGIGVGYVFQNLRQPVTVVGIAHEHIDDHSLCFVASSVPK
jgi:hypothetical protein